MALPTTLVAGALALVQAPAAPLEPFVAPDWRPAAVELPERPDVIDFELARTRPVPVVEVGLDDLGPRRFFFDTGATLTVIDVALARSMGLELGEDVSIGDASDAERVVAQRVLIPSLRVGATIFRDVPAVAVERARFGGQEGVHGVLGLPLFADCLFTLDYPHEALVLQRGELPEVDGREILGYRMHEGLPLFDLSVEGRAIGLHIDSGAPSGITLPRAFAEELAWKRAPRMRGLGRTVNNEFEIWQGVLDGDVILGAHVFEDPQVNLNDEIPMAFLGYRSLRHFALTFDQAGARVRLQQPGRGGPRTPGPR